MPRLRALAIAAATLLTSAARATAQLTSPLDSATLASFRWRSIGPANMAGRVVDIEGDPRNPKVFYVAAAAGGIWKTINAGTTFFPIFDRERVISLGDIALAPSNPDIIYAGTGEQNSRNSISPGGGIYKSTDGGKTWKLSGLEQTQVIGRIVVDPQDANIVYVAALGHIWNANPERGLYKSTDGGATWTMSKFINARTGFVDVAMDPSDHNTLYAAAWERVRTPYSLQSGGPGSGLWKTTDAGKTWTEIKGNGFPTTNKGRMGLAISPSNPKVIYANVEADTNPHSLGKGERPDTTRRQKIQSGIYRSADGGATWTQTFNNGYALEQRPFYYSQVRVDPKNENRIYWMSSVFRFSDDGGKTSRRGALSIHTDWHAMWIDPNDPDHFIIGSDGGIAQTFDKGGSYDFINTFPIGQFYEVSFDMQKPYRVCGGLQDNGSWCGPSRTANRFGIMNENWFNVGGGDGFYTAQDPTNPNIIYSESQGGNISRLDLSSGARAQVMRGGGRDQPSQFEDSLIVARGDTTVPESPTVARALAALRAQAVADSARKLRFNWETPFFLSVHAPSTIYAGGNRVMKSTDRGDHWVPISPDLSTQDSTRIVMSTRLTGGITRDATGAETHGTVVALAESPIRPGILWAGTDDGNVWYSTNDGGAWTNITNRFAGVPPKTWVSRLEPSHFDTATVYVAFDNHRENDFTPYLFTSTDFGRTFHRIVANLPTGGVDYVHVIREDPFNRDLLYVGTDVGAYVSTDRGTSWQRFMSGLPTVPVYDLRIHPRDRELIAATHGRSIWIADVAALEDMRDSVMKRPAQLFAIRNAYEYTQTFSQAWNGNKVFQVDNPPYGATIAFRVANAAPPAPASDSARADTKDTRAAGQGDFTVPAPRDSARITITDVKGDTIRTLMTPINAGINRVYWDLRAKAKPLGPKALRDSIIGERVKKQKADSAKAADLAAKQKTPPTSNAKAPNDTSAKLGVVGSPPSNTGADSTRGRRGGAGRGRGAGAGEINLRPAEAPAGASNESLGERFGFGRRNGPLVAPGDYLVTVSAGGQTMRQVVRVERVTDILEEEADDMEDRQ